jgi:hypothetical protein
MQDFMEIDDARKISLGEYLAGLADAEERSRITAVFDDVSGALESMRRNFAVPDEVPDVYVLTSDRYSAEVNPLGLMVVSQGIIAHCLNATRPQTISSTAIGGSTDTPPDLYAQMGLTWVMAHEYAHLFRKHHEVQTEIGSEDYVLRAFEHDADLCAAAAVYRAAQLWLAGMKDTDIRAYVVEALFWIIRRFPGTNDGAGIHPSFSERFIQIVLKLTTLVTSQGEEPDNELRLPATRRRGEVLREVAMSCESAYQIEHPEAQTSYFMEWREYFAQYGHISIINDWVRVSQYVERYSNTIADPHRNGVSPMTMGDIERLEVAARKRERRANAKRSQQ